MSNKNLTIGIAVAVILAIVGIFLPQAGVSKLFGSTSCASITCLSGGLRLVTDAGGDFEADVASVFSGTTKLGANGTALTQVLSGTCNLSQLTVGSFTPSTTAQFICPVSNVAASDKVFISMPEGAGKNADGAASATGPFIAVSGYATSTGQIGVTLFNQSGAATSSFTQATTGVQYLIVR